MIVDSSGSMYGEGLTQAKHFVKQFASHNLRENRNMAVYTYPEGLLSKPSNNVGGFHSNSKSSSRLGSPTSKLNCVVRKSI